MKPETIVWCTRSAKVLVGRISARQCRDIQAWEILEWWGGEVGKWADFPEGENDDAVYALLGEKIQEDLDRIARGN